MPTVDSLPADQRAVLSLLLQQGRTYEQIAGTLRISEAAVRERAHGALAALGPAGTDLSARRRGEIGDWLLRQGPADERQETEAYLSRSEPGRAWARGVVAALGPLGADSLPELPGDEGGAPAPAERAPAERVPAERAPATGTRDVPRPRVSRTGGAVLLAGLALLLGGGAFLLFHGGGEDKATPAAATSTAGQADPKVVAQVNLKPPGGAPAPEALGVMQVIKQQQQEAVVVQAQKLPALPRKTMGYGVWVSSSPSRRVFLGYANFDPSSHRLTGYELLNADVTTYGEVFVTRETGQGPKRPGTIYLRGTVRTPGG
jgi:Sigma-70, region 4